MYNKNNLIVQEGDVISMENRRKYKWKGYDIQTVDIQPGDTILFHINDDVDLYSVSALMEEMSKTFPQNVVIPVNEWILKGMTVIRQAKSVADMVDMSIIDRPLEEEYPELFRNDYWYWQGGSKK